MNAVSACFLSPSLKQICHPDRSGGTCFSFILLSILEGNRPSPLCHPDRTADSCSAVPDVFACAAFCKESRMKLVNAIELDRNPGGQRRDLRCAFTANEGPPSELANPAQAIC
jgi:hypothetical protein